MKPFDWYLGVDPVTRPFTHDLLPIHLLNLGRATHLWLGMMVCDGGMSSGAGRESETDVDEEYSGGSDWTRDGGR